MASNGVTKTVAPSETSTSNLAHVNGHAGPTSTASTTAAQAVRKPKRSSAMGDTIFIGYVAIFAGCVLAGYRGLIPFYNFELMSLKEATDLTFWTAAYWYVPFILSVLYIALTFGTQAYMVDKKPFDLRMPLAAWSLFLSVFSFIGAVRTIPPLVKIIETRGVVALVCGDTRSEWLSDNPAGFWTFIFCMSKVPELIDTAFIVLRKKPLITLHWFHHFTVMLFCWQSWSSACLNGLIFASMNLTVHTVMYFFYFMAAMGQRPSTFDKFITIGQILQMVVGTMVTTYVTLDKLVWHPVDKIDLSFNPPKWLPYPPGVLAPLKECHVSSGNAVLGLMMYASYLALFVAFFYSAYLKPGGRDGASA